MSFVVLEAPRDLAAFAFDDGLGDFVVFEYEARPGGPPVALTRAEREVLDLLLRGLTNGSIAARRRRSCRTVANQVAALLAKHHVHGRNELFALLAHRQMAP